MKLQIISAFSRRWVLLIACTLHSFFLLTMTYIWLNQPISYADEALLVKGSMIAKRMLVGLDDRPEKNRFAFFNVSWDKQLIPKYDTSGAVVGQWPITDRAKLAQLLTAIQKADAHKALLIDINFDLKSPQDTILRPVIESIPRTLISYHKEQKKPIFSTPKGLADYDSDFGTFFKYTLMYDSIKTIPVALYELAHPGKEVDNSGWITTVNGSWVLNTSILDYRIRPYHLQYMDKQGKPYYEYYQMGRWLREIPPPAQEAYLKEALKDKIVVIGDFEDRDVHETLLGDMAGPLILVNAFLALEHKDMAISWVLVSFLFIVYFLFSLDVFTLHKIGIRTPWAIRLLKTDSGKLLGDFFGYFFFLMLSSLFCYFVFGLHLNVLLFAVYLSGLEYLVSFVSKRIRKAEQAS